MGHVEDIDATIEVATERGNLSILKILGKEDREKVMNGMVK